MQISEQTLDFYGQLLNRDENRTVEICEPKILTDTDIRIQDIRTGQGSNQIRSELNRAVRGMAYQVLRKTLLDDKDRGILSIGTIDTDGDTDNLPELLFHPKVITGKISRLTIQPVSPEELSEVIKVPTKSSSPWKQHVEDMDAFLLLSGEMRISRSIGLIATGIRLSEFRTSREVQSLGYKTAHVLDEKDRLIRGGTIARTPGDNIYTFHTNAKRRNTAKDSLGALINSSMNARNIEARQRANPFGGMRE